MVLLCERLGDSLDDLEPGVVASEVEDGFSGVPNDPAGAVDEVLQDGLYAPALHLYLFRGEVFVAESLLPEGAQQVEGNHGTEQDNAVGA